MAERILLVDNEEFQGTLWCHVLRQEGYIVEFTNHVDDALALLKDRKFDLLVTDLRMAPGKAFSVQESMGGYATGLCLAIEVRRLSPTTKVIVYTSGCSDVVKPWLHRDRSVPLLEKPNLPEDLINVVYEQLEGRRRNPRVFLVHGRDNEALYKLKDLIQNRLHLGEPIILAEQPSQGMALIEKFESYAQRVDLVFVLLTPDDIGTLAQSQTPRERPRLNVVFELGYFLGAMRRLSGRILLLVKGQIELPSDIAGVVYIDITHGIDAAEGDIRRELPEWL